MNLRHLFSAARLHEARRFVSSAVNIIRLLPPELREFWEGDTRTILIAASGKTVVTRLKQADGKETAMATRTDAGSWMPEAAWKTIRKVSRNRPVVIQVLPEIILEQKVKIPVAALANVADAIHYGIRSWTPFSQDEIYFGYHVDQISALHADIRLRYVMRHSLASQVAATAEAGFAADHVALGDGTQWLVPIDPRKAESMKRAWRIDVALGISAVGLLLIATTLVWHFQDATADHLDQAIRSEIHYLQQIRAQRGAASGAKAGAQASSARRRGDSSIGTIYSALFESSHGAKIVGLKIESDRGRASFILPSHSPIPSFDNMPFMSDIQPEAVSSGSDIRSFTFSLRPRA